ncbi:MAG: Mth938-like domain-containing protein [Paracoccus sp. (in: a-proteobacteria)]|nr:Mth938-like domain-containing protein [Paracoccus sp. (in: a-proteobacteria)]
MRLAEARYPSGALPVDGYGPGFFRLGGQVIQGPLLLSPAGQAAWQGLDDLAAFGALAGQADVLFLGMGADIARPSATLMTELTRLGLMPEPMSTPSAARSYNVLLAEGRRVACALIPV